MASHNQTMARFGRQEDLSTLQSGKKDAVRKMNEEFHEEFFLKNSSFQNYATDLPGQVTVREGSFVKKFYSGMVYTYIPSRASHEIYGNQVSVEKDMLIAENCKNKQNKAIMKRPSFY